MPSIAKALGGLFKSLHGVDTVIDVGSTVGRIAAGTLGAGGETVDMKKARRIGAAVLEVARNFLAEDETGRRAFLKNRAAIDRVVDTYYSRLTEQAEIDRYEAVFGGDVLTAIIEGLGLQQSAPAQQTSKKRSPQPRQQPQSLLGNISPADLFLGIRACLGEEALRLDQANHRGGGAVKPTKKGDAVITKGITRLCLATLGERVEEKAKKGLGALTDVLEAFSNGYEENP